MNTCHPRGNCCSWHTFVVINCWPVYSMNQLCTLKIYKSNVLFRVPQCGDKLCSLRSTPIRCKRVIVCRSVERAWSTPKRWATGALRLHFMPPLSSCSCASLKCCGFCLPTRMPLSSLWRFLWAPHACWCTGRRVWCSMCGCRLWRDNSQMCLQVGFLTFFVVCVVLYFSGRESLVCEPL